MTTIRFLAKIANVAPSTVSRALRDDPSIGLAMRQRIRELAREYHYHPNQLMHGLLTGQSGVIGIVLPQLTVSFNARMLSAMLDSVMDAEYRSLIFETYGNPEKVQYAVHAMIEQRVDGAILYTGRAAPLPRELLFGLRSHGIPAISIDATGETVELDTVRTDERELVGIAVDYLISLGHRHIAWFNTAPSLRGEAVRHHLAQRLLSTRWCFDTPGTPGTPVQASALLDLLLVARPGPTAVIAGDDHLAATMLAACHERGITVPGEMSIMGCGNLTVGEFTAPRLTTIDQHPEQISRTAMRLLQSRMRDPDDPRPPATYFIPCQLTPRASCGPPEQDHAGAGDGGDK